MPRRTHRTARDVIRFLAHEEIAFVDFKFVDLIGNLQHLTYPADQVDENLFLSGIAFDGSSVRGFQEIDESDMAMRPDPDTLFVDPFYDERTASVFCDIIDPIRHAPYSRDPRGVAKRAENLIRSLGIGDEAFFGPELEFFILDSIRFDQTTQHGYYYLDLEAGFWNSGGGPEGAQNLGGRPGRKQAYFAAPPIDRNYNLRTKITGLLRDVGLKPELHHHEVGAGQQEIGFRFGTLTRQAEAALKYKYVVKNTARRYGKTATFMPKPLFQDNGSGMHVHVSIWKDGVNRFYQDGEYADLSPLARHFIAGLLEHAPALCALCNPTTNSYRRLVPGYEAPINLVFSQRNRSACIRVPLTGHNAAAKRIEYRTPDPSANPYLAFSAILCAGVDGIVRELVPPAPMDEDIYKLAGTARGRAIRNTPPNLNAALDALEADNAFLLRNGVFTEDLLQHWLDLKRADVEHIALRPHPSEFALYYDV